MDSARVLARFEAERQALALMSHPNIAGVLDAGATAAGRPFFVMELVGGVPITDYCDQHRLSTRERLALFISVCEAVQHAHQKGVIHRDLKPSNVLVEDREGVAVPKVIDFGIAKATGGTLGEVAVTTAVEQFMGTPAYMSPEQAEMTGLNVDTRTDIYALGVLLYELLTGKTPFDAKDLAQRGLDSLRRTICETPPVRPSTRLASMRAQDLETTAARRHADPPKLISQVRGDLDWIVMKALEKERTRRYATANGLATDVKRFLNHEPVLARPPSPAYQMRKFVRRHRAPVAAAVIVVVSLICGVCLSLREASQAEQARAAEQEQRRGAQRALALNRIRTAEDYFPDNPSISLAYLARVVRDDPGNQPAAQRLVSALTYRKFNLPEPKPLEHAGTVNSARFSPDAARIVTASDDGTAQIWETTTGNPSGPPLHHRGPVRWAEFNPDGSRVVTASVDGTARVWEVQTGQPAGDPLEHSNVVSSAHFSADGQLLATASDDGFARIWQVTTGKLIIAPLDQGTHVLVVRFSPDANFLLTSSDQSKIAKLWNIAGGAGIARLLRHGNLICAADFSPDGKWVATACYDATVRVWDSRSGEPVVDPLNHPAALRSVQFSKDGKLLLTGCMDGKARLWRTDTFACIATFAPAGAIPISFAQFHPAEEMVLTAAVDGTVRLWDAVSGAPACEPMRHQGLINSVQFSPDGDQLLIASGRRAVLWRLRQTASMGRTFTHDAHGLTNGVTTAVFSPDGLKVATGSRDHTARIWDARTGHILAELPHRTAVTLARFNPDGRLLITGAADGEACIWDASTGKLARRLPSLTTATNFVHTASFSPDSARVITGDTGTGASLWDLATGQRVRSYLHPVKWGEIWSAEFSPNGRLMVAAADGGAAQVFDAATGDPVGQPLLHEEAVVSARFSPDGRQVLTGSWDGTARLWDALTGKPSPLSPWRHEGRVLWVAFSPDGSKVATASADSTARLWNTQTGASLADPLRHRGPVVWAEFSRDGGLVVTASADGSARVWDARTGLALSEPLRHGARVNHAAFSPAGDAVLTASEDGTARLWPFFRVDGRAPEWLAELAEALGGQRLNADGQLEPVGLDKLVGLRARLSNRKRPVHPLSSWLGEFLNDDSKADVSASR
jgi:WD40 repeat protein